MSEDQGLELAKEGVKQILEPVKDFMQKLLGPAATEIGLSLGDSLRVWRLKRAVRLVQDVEQIILDAGLEMKPVAPRLLFPILEGASLEDEEDMHQRWVALLTNTAKTDFDSEIPPYFPDILKQLTSAEAQFLDVAHDDATSDAERRSTPNAAIYGVLELDRISGDVLKSAHPLMIENLERLMLVSRNSGVSFSTDKRQVHNTFSASNHLYITNIGKAFVRACRLPKRSGNRAG